MKIKRTRPGFGDEWYNGFSGHNAEPIWVRNKGNALKLSPLQAETCSRQLKSLGIDNEIVE